MEKQKEISQQQTRLEKVTQQNLAAQRVFVSPTYGNLTFKEVIFRMGQFMHKQPKASYDLVIGTDSQVYPDHTDFISAIIAHRRGGGGIYFWKRIRDKSNYMLRDRMYQEAVLSMELSRQLMDELQTEGILRFNFEIHVDIGEGGRTREMVNEVVGMVRGSGFEVKIKPQAYGAASVADRHT